MYTRIWDTKHNKNGQPEAKIVKSIIKFCSLRLQIFPQCARGLVTPKTDKNLWQPVANTFESIIKFCSLRFEIDCKFSLAALGGVGHRKEGHISYSVGVGWLNDGRRRTASLRSVVVGLVGSGWKSRSQSTSKYISLC